MKKLLIIFGGAFLLVGALSQAADAAQWQFHQYLTRGGTVTVWGTVNCQTVGPPLFNGPIEYCNNVSGWVPPWCNDYLTVNQWDRYNCGNIDSNKVAVKYNDNGVWRLRPLNAWMDGFLPPGGTVIPGIGDSTGGTPYVHVIVNLDEWLADPRPLQNIYFVHYGQSPELPGYMIGTTPIVFDSLAAPWEDPFSTTPFTGMLWRSCDVTFTSEQPTPCCDVNMVPDTYPINVHPGGSFGLTGIIGNPTGAPIVTDVWVGVVYLNTFYQLWLFNNIPLAPGQYISAHLNQAVPGYAPLGTYVYKAYCGDKPTNVKCDSASFNFTVYGARVDGGATDWTLEGGFNGQDMPTEYALVGSHPNPFNATTTITYALPTAGNVNLEVYNIAGQKVATLVDGYNEAGQHSVIWDAANYSSGIYFYKLSAGEKVFTDRMTLLK